MEGHNEAGSMDGVTRVVIDASGGYHLDASGQIVHNVVSRDAKECTSLMRQDTMLCLLERSLR